MSCTDIKRELAVFEQAGVVRSKRTGRHLQKYTFIFCLNVLFLGVLPGQTLATSVVTDPNTTQTRSEQLSRRLEELISQLRRKRSDYYVQKAQYENRIDKARENRKILQNELKDLRQQESETNQQIQKYEVEVEDLKKKLVSREPLEEAVKELIEPFLVKQRMAIEKGIPYKQQERIARLEAATGDANDLSNISTSDRLGHIWNYGQEELRLARSSETYSQRAKTADGSSPHARFFRVGQKILGYVTEDGRQSAMWLSLPDDENWLFITDTKQSAQIRNAVEILDRRQGPRLVTLPIVLWPESPEKENADVSP